MTTKASPTTNTSGSDFRQVVHFLREQSVRIALWAVAALIAAAFYLEHREVVYASRAVLEVRAEPRKTVLGPEETNPTISASLLKTIEQSLASQVVLRRVIQWEQETMEEGAVKTEISGNEGRQVQELRHKLSVDLVRGTRLIAITVRDPDPKRARDLASAIVRAFFEQNSDLLQEGTAAQAVRLTTETDRLKAELREAEERVHHYREEHPSVAVTDQNNIVVERMSELNRQVAEAKNRRLGLEPDYQAIQRAGVDKAEALAAIPSVTMSASVAGLRSYLMEQEAELATLKLRYRDKHPDVMRMRGSVAEARRAFLDTVKLEAESITQAYESARTVELALERELTEQENLALEQSRDAIQLRSLEQDVASTARLYQEVLSQQKANAMFGGPLGARDASSGAIRVIEQPIVADEPASISALVYLALAPILGALFGLCWALAQHALDNTISSLDGAESFLGIPSVGVVPRSKYNSFKRGPLATARPQTMDAEAFRSMATTLSVQGDEDSNRFTLFTSALPGEGKSFCAINYAATLAEEGKRTLLLDGDLRCPSVLKALVPDDKDHPELVDCFRDMERCDEAIRPTRTRNLWVLGQRRGLHESGAILSGPELGELLAMVGAQFDRVVIDSAPVTAVSDTLYLAKYAPTVCLVVRAGHTPKRVVRRASQLLARGSRAPTGLVLNQIRKNSAANYYYYGERKYITGLSTVPT